MHIYAETGVASFTDLDGGLACLHVHNFFSLSEVPCYGPVDVF